MVHDGKAEDTRHKLQEGKFRLDRRKNMLVVGRVRQWSSSPREVVHCVLRGFQGQARWNPQEPGVSVL